MSIHCSGTAGVMTQRCPMVSFVSTCGSIAADFGSVMTGGTSGCSVRSYTATNVTCACVFGANSASSGGPDVSARRKLQVAGYNFTEPDGYSVSYVAMLSSTADSFVSTIKTADDLNASTVARGWRAIATLGALAAAVVVSLLWSNHADFKMKKVLPADEDASAQQQHQLVPSSLAAAKGSKSTGKKGKSRFKFGSKTKKVIVNAELSIVENSLPKALSSRTFTDRFLEEVKQHHRWFGIIFYFSDSFPRVLRVVSLATNAIVMLFIQSITYNLTNPDDGTCEALYSEADCLVPKSPFATGESKCAWVAAHSSGASATVDGECVYIEPDQSVRIILFVAIFCAIVTTPIALTVDWILQNVLAAPTEAEPNGVDSAAIATAAEALSQPEAPSASAVSAAASTDADLSSVVPTSRGRPAMLKRKSSSSQLRDYFGLFSSEAALKADKALLATSRAELIMLSLSLRKYREHLHGDQLEEFNREKLLFYII